MSAVFVFLVLLPTSFTATESLEDTGRIEGRVIDRELNPLAKVDVYLLGIANYEACIVTDETGSFSFTNLIPGTYDLTISKLGYHSSPDDDDSIAIRLSKAQRYFVESKLIPCNGCFGAVSDSFGKPVFMASVLAIPLNSPGYDRAYTNRLGRFHFDSLQPDPVHITAYHPAYEPIRIVGCAKDRLTHTFTFPELATLIVHIVVPDGVSMPQQVRLLPPGVPYRSRALSKGGRFFDGHTIVTYAHGRTVVVSAMSPGFERTPPQSIDLVAGETRELTFELRPNKPTTFCVVDDDGERLEGVRISGRGLESKKTDKGGLVEYHFLTPPDSLTFEGLAFSTVILDDFANQFEFQPRLFDEPLRVVMRRNRVDSSIPSESKSHAFATNESITSFVKIDPPNETHAVSGTVLDLRRSPIPYCLVILEGYGQVYADFSGRFFFGDVPRGHYVLRAQDLPEPLAFTPKAIHVSQEIHDITVQARVGRWVRFRSNRGYYGRVVSPTPSSRLKDDGIFDLLLPEGRNSMSILMSGVEDREGYMGTAVAYVDIDVSSPMNLDSRESIEPFDPTDNEVIHNVTLTEAYPVRLVIQGLDSQVLRNVPYSIEAPRNSRLAVPTIYGRTDSDGFGSEFLPVGPYILRATLPDGIELRARMAITRIHAWESASHTKNSFVFRAKD